MSRSANAARAQTPRKVPRWLRSAGLAAGSTAIALAAMLYLAGYGFLWSIGEPPRTASPLTWIRYAYYYHEVATIRVRLALSALGGVAPLLGVGVALALPRRRLLHGEARFARGSEIARAGLLGEHGIILGKIRGRYLMLDGQQGVALAAPPRAGKGVGIVIPNALNWPGSLVCVDIKRENWAVTAGYRSERGQDCYLMDLLAQDGVTARWNPLGYVDEHPGLRVNSLQQIAEMLFPDPFSGDPFWNASARSVFLGIALYLFETPGKPRTLGEILRHGMASDAEGFEEHWRRTIEGRQSGTHPLSRECVQTLYDAIKLWPGTASSIRKTFTSRLDLWLNPLLDAATAENDFDLRELRRRPMSIYVGVNPDDLHRLRPVLSLFFQQAIGLQTRELPEHNPDLNVQVMMLLDEFTALGRLPIMAESISYLPGYNVRAVLVIQSISQLREVYGPNNAETMLKSLGARIVFAPKDFADAREISEDLGYTTVKARTVSRGGFAGFSGKGSRGPSVSFSEQRRALLLPQEVKELGTGKAIIFCEGLRPVLCDKVRYFDEPVFKRRLRAAPLRARPHRKSDEVLPTVAGTETLQSREIEPRGTIGPDESGHAEANEAAETSSVNDVDPRDALDRLDQLVLADFTQLDQLDDVFAQSASAVEPHSTPPLSDEQLHAMALRFVATLDRSEGARP